MPGIGAPFCIKRRFVEHKLMIPLYSAQKQRERFHAQIQEIRKFAQQMKEREKQQEEIREKYRLANQRQQDMKQKLDSVLSKLVAISRKGGYNTASAAEEEYTEEIRGIERIANNVQKKEEEASTICPRAIADRDLTKFYRCESSYQNLVIQHLLRQMLQRYPKERKTMSTLR